MWLNPWSPAVVVLGEVRKPLGNDGSLWEEVRLCGWPLVF